jgi:uncharacterized protein YbbK (DUF523 family)
MHEKPLIGVSRCLLGHAVRYDGESKPHSVVIEQLGQLFEFVPVCPEVEAGLSIPRSPVQLSGSIDDPSITGRDDPELDVTELMLTYCNSRPAELKQLSGFVFKSRSPSCGLNTTPVFIDGNCITDNSRGLFARAMTSLYPELPVIEETGLEPDDKRELFIERIYSYMKHNLQGT